MTKYFCRYLFTGEALMFPKLAHCSAYVLVTDDEASQFDSMTEANIKAMENGLKSCEFKVELTSAPRVRQSTLP